MPTKSSIQRKGGLDMPKKKQNEEVVYVVYCYYPPFSKLPKRKWVKFRSKEAAREFVAKKVEGRKDRYLWSYVVNNMEVDEL